MMTFAAILIALLLSAVGLRAWSVLAPRPPALGYMSERWILECQSSQPTSSL